MTTPTRFSGKRIRQARHEAGMTQAALAMAAGTRERNIIRWENEQHSPRFEHVAAIAQATGKEIGFFADDSTSTDDDDEEAEPVSALLMRAAYHLDKAGDYEMADRLRMRVRRAIAESESPKEALP